MTDNEVLQMILDIKEIQVDGFEVEDQRIHIHCSSVLKRRCFLIGCTKEKRSTSPTFGSGQRFLQNKLFSK